MAAVPSDDEVAGSYALMDSHYARLGHPFRQACHVYGTVVSATPKYAVADVGRTVAAYIQALHDALAEF